MTDTATFKEAFRRYPSGIAVITTVGPDGPVGITASSVASVAADPPTLSFSVSSGGRSTRELLGSRNVSVHLLPQDRVDLADAFATSDGARFAAGQGWEVGPQGQLVLPDALANLRCLPETLVPVGASTVVVARVLGIGLGPDTAPLVHHDRGYWRVGGPLVRHRTSAAPSDDRAASRPRIVTSRQD